MNDRERLAEVIDRHAAMAKQETEIAGVAIFKVEAPTLPVKSIYTPRLCVVIQGRKEIILGSRNFEVDDTQYFVAAVNLPVSARIPAASSERPHYALSIELSRQDLAEVLPHVSARPSPTRHNGLSVGTQTDDMLSALSRLMDLLDRPADIPALLKPVKTELYYRLLQGEHGSTLRDYAATGSRIAQIGRATSWLRQHYDQPVSIEKLAAIAGMSPTSFHRHFKATTLMSPLEYRMHVRLQEARKRLLVDGSSARNVAFEVGYDSQTQFTREYKRLFGRPPIHDTAHLRGNG